jgi:nucleoside-diphosphate-sugar epimerase
VVRYYESQFRCRATIVRPFNIYGPGQGEQFLIPTLVRQALDPAVAEIVVNDLRPRRDYIHVRDLVAMLTTTARRPSGVFNAGSGHSVSIGELVDAIASVTGTPKPVRSRGQARPEEVLDVVADISKAKSELAWSPRVPLRDGIEEIVAAAGAAGIP